MLYLWIMLGSALGGATRYWLSGVISNRIGETFPWGTMIVNISGCFFIGFFATLTGPDGRLWVGTTARQFVMIGICGGYTTFSSFSLQTFTLAQSGEWLLAGANAGLSMVLCILAVWLGHVLALLTNELNLGAVFELLWTPLGWAWALIVSVSALVWFLVRGRVKGRASRLSGRKPPSDGKGEGLHPDAVSQGARKAIARPAWNWRIPAGALIVLMGAGGWFLWTLHGGGRLAEKPGQTPLVHTVAAMGVISAAHAVPVGTHVSGVIEARDCAVATKVKAGQLCAKIDPRPYRAAVAQEKAKLAEARSRLEKDKAALAHAEARFERNQRRAKRRAISLAALAQSRNAYERARARSTPDATALAERQEALRAAESNLANTDIVAPIDGTVVARDAEIGETVTPGSATPLFRVASDLTLVHVEAHVSAVDIGDVKRGDKATFTVGPLPDHPFTGEVTDISQWPRTNGALTTYAVIISAPNPDLLLQPGMAAAVTIIVHKQDGDRHQPAGVVHAS